MLIWRFSFCAVLLLGGLLNASAYGEDLIKQRLAKEQQAYDTGFALIPYHSNYILPATYMHSASSAHNPGSQYELQHAEVKFQFSVKIPIIRHGFLGDNGYLFAAYTNTSVWQAYNKSKSSPFRDTNHSPELFFLFSPDWHWQNVSLPLLSFGFVHQSNGQPVQRSRSWNRLYFNTVFSFNDWYISVKPWWRIPERKKRDINDAKGDDNPDIEHYYGHFELNIVKEFGANELSLMLRNNLKHPNYGAIEIGISHPISKRISFYTQIFHGYGEMLLDYNQRNTRIGFGFLFGNSL